MLVVFGFIKKCFNLWRCQNFWFFGFVSFGLYFHKRSKFIVLVNFNIIVDIEGGLQHRVSCPYGGWFVMLRQLNEVCQHCIFRKWFYVFDLCPIYETVIRSCIQRFWFLRQEILYSIVSYLCNLRRCLIIVAVFTDHVSTRIL